MGSFAQVKLQWGTALGVVTATSCVSLDPHGKKSDPTEKSTTHIKLFDAGRSILTSGTDRTANTTRLVHKWDCVTT